MDVWTKLAAGALGMVLLVGAMWFSDRADDDTPIRPIVVTSSHAQQDEDARSEPEATASREPRPGRGAEDEGNDLPDGTEPAPAPLDDDTTSGPVPRGDDTDARDDDDRDDDDRDDDDDRGDD